jgi:cyclic pyranopterin phosphate synthase
MTSLSIVAFGIGDRAVRFAARRMSTAIGSVCGMRRTSNESQISRAYPGADEPEAPEMQELEVRVYTPQAGIAEVGCSYQNLSQPRWQMQRSSPDCNDLGSSKAEETSLTHVTADGRRAAMVDVGRKRIVRRDATAQCVVHFPTETLQALGLLCPSKAWEQRDITNLGSKKGPILTTATVAGVMGAKKTSELVPFCHPLPLDGVHVNLAWVAHDMLQVTCRAAVTHSTGVEMEALMGASTAALCIYDMCKASSHDIRITDLQLVAKSGGNRNFKR